MSSKKQTKVISVGSVKIGGDNPIAVQSMTNTNTKDQKATIGQILEIQKAGADLVRVSCPDKDSCVALSNIIKNVNIPVIADIHFDYRLAIGALKAGAHCIRINPGNIGKAQFVKDIIKAAKDYNAAVRIGVNSGSLEKEILDKYQEPNSEAIVESALGQVKFFEDNEFFNFKISVKSSNLFLAYEAYTKVSNLCDYPLHLGITEAGSMISGTVLSSIGMGRLLWEGIGDTIRVSLSSEPSLEVKVGFEILKHLDLRQKGVKIISCPSCARQGFNVIQTIETIEKRLEYMQTNLVISILGCVVNGIGEAKHSNIGIVGMPNAENLVYIDGKKQNFTVKNEEIVDKVVEIAERYK